MREKMSLFNTLCQQRSAFLDCSFQRFAFATKIAACQFNIVVFNLADTR
jgi:hypothetical protein